MKKFAVALAFVLVGSLFMAAPAKAVGSKTLPLCSTDSSKACIQSFSIRGAGISDWVEIPNPTTTTDYVGIRHFYNAAGTAYSPDAGYGTTVEVAGDAFTGGNNYGIYISSSNGTTETQANGPYEKHLDPRTEVRVVLNTKSTSTQSMISMNISNGSERIHTVSGSDNIVTITAKVARQTSVNSMNSAPGDFSYWNGPASQVRDGILELRGTAVNADALSGKRIYDGMSVDTNASSANSPFVIAQFLPETNQVYYDSFKVLLKAPHTLTDGVTVNTGHYSATIPSTFLEMMGMTQEQVLAAGASLTADYTLGQGAETPMQSILEAAPNGAVKLTAVGLHYSTPDMKTKFKSLPQTANVGAAVKKGKKLVLPLKTTQGIATSWKSTSPKICKVTSTKKTTKKKVGKKTVKTVTITKWQVQGKKKGTCTVVGTNSGNSSFGPANISKTIAVS